MNGRREWDIEYVCLPSVNVRPWYGFSSNFFMYLFLMSMYVHYTLFILHSVLLSIQS